MLNSRLISLVSASALILAGGLAGTASAAAPEKPDTASLNKNKHTNSVYIVRMADDPVVAYDGSIKGYPATAPKKGQKIDPDNPQVQKYFGYLAEKHDKALSKVGGASKIYDYGYAFNGFAAELTPAQADKLKATAGVLSVEKDQARPLDTATTPAFLGLSGPGGFWTTTGARGENVIIGVVDGGIWPEHPSFSDRTGTNGNDSKDGKLDYQQIPGWHGKCVPGENFTAANCNQKVIGARYYNSGWGGNAGIDATLPWEFNSPRDFGGHGTHTSSTAGGNEGVTVTGPAAVLGKINGIAPRARIATYKVCWETLTSAGGQCFQSDSVAAIDQAVADGVDVINFSVGGSRTNFRDSVEIAFLYAADAGVFVATSAGNSGPTPSTVAHPGPWLTTVAAGTHNRDGAGSITLGNDETYTGASLAEHAVTAPIINSSEAGLPGADPTAIALCYSSADGYNGLDPAKVAGKIVVCDRGVTARVNKSLAVQETGGVGMVLVNTSPSSLNADFHAVPSVHLQNTANAPLHAYAATAGATATIAKGEVVLTAPAPYTAGFSSRGPLLASGSLLKPDLIAPGQDILAGVAPPGNGGKLFDLYSGTSMSSPHVAGLAALMKELHPDWSPMMIKSALMTTGYDVLDGGTPAPNTDPELIFSQGAGHVKPNSAADPGLVFDSGYLDWLAFICSTQPEGLTNTCNAVWSLGYPRNASDFNSPSIAFGALPGSQTVTRTVKNVGPTETYTASVDMPGFDVTGPAEFTIAHGASHSFQVSFARTDAPLNLYSGGQLTLTGSKGHVVRLPIVARPVALAAPAEVAGSGTTGSTTFPVTFGYDGDYTAAPHGLVPALMTPGNVADDPGDSFAPFGPGTTLHRVAVPSGSAYARFSLFDAYTDGNDDLDLYVYYPNGSYAGGSGSGTSAEQVDIAMPPPGSYYVFVHGWQTDGPDANYTLFSWSVPATPGSTNLAVTAPASATLGATGNVVVDWSGLDAGTKYLGAVSHSDADSIEALTIISVATD
jgi:hypothetical protein